MRFFLHLAYNGYRYHGWQRQSKVRSVQEILEEKLSRIFKKKILVHGCGRTDAKVHASQYFAHINISSYPDFDLCFRLNKILPKDIVAYDLIPVESKQHAQRDALKRTYNYFLHAKNNPFLADFSVLHSLDPDNFPMLEEAAEIVNKQSDFRAFCISPESYKTTECIIYASKWTISPKGSLKYSITANRFLRGMIRILVARMINIAEGKMTSQEFEFCFQSGNKPKLLRSAHPQGLFLSKVEYPYLSLQPRDLFW